MTLIAMSRKITALVLAGGLVLSSQMATVASAEMISTDAAIARAAAEADRATLLSELQREDIRAEIAAAGVDPAEAERRLEALSDAEVAALLDQIEAGEAGGNAIVGAAVTVFLVLLVTDLLCLTSVFSFTRCAR